jgi:bifunctional non-homologous end joining protein LigD
MNWFDKKIIPMLAIRGRPFSSPDYIFEPKWDGTRCLAFVDIDEKRVRLQNRRLADITKRYPELEFFEFLEENAIIDGEIVVLEGGKPSFKLLQRREQVDSKLKIDILSRTAPAVYFAFDILYTDTMGWITDEPLSERKEILRKISRETSHIMFSEFIKEKGEQFYRLSVDAGLEGIIAKKIDSKYQSGKRSSEWIKIKKRNTVDCIIAGWLEGEGRRADFFGSLVLVLLKKDEYVHVGNVGTGFSNEFIKSFSKTLRENETCKSETLMQNNFKRKVHWVKPKYVCEVEFLEVTQDKKLRSPVFLRLRSDKVAEECTIDQLKIEEKQK